MYWIVWIPVNCSIIYTGGVRKFRGLHWECSREELFEQFQLQGNAGMLSLGFFYHQIQNQLN